jgi:hypothetical protein
VDRWGRTEAEQVEGQARGQEGALAVAQGGVKGDDRGHWNG